jgi:hypothetical protein
VIHKSTHRGVEFLCEKVDQSNLHAWYDSLRPSEVKDAITKIKCREYRPYDQASFRLVVLCRHPFSVRPFQAEGNQVSTGDRAMDPMLDVAISPFTDWIGRHEMPEEALLGSRYAFVDWWPIEMLPLVLDDLSPQEQAEMEMNNHILACLELIRLATTPDQGFLQLWIGSNEPFFAAGRLIYGGFQWVREVPLNAFRDEAETQALLERIGECSREYVGLIRMASLTEAESPLLDRVSFAIRRFNFRHSSEIPSWQLLACDLLDKTEALPLDPKIGKPELYDEIEAACDELRHDLVRVTEGLENEIPVLINAVLPTLPMPPSAALFADKASS